MAKARDMIFSHGWYRNKCLILLIKLIFSLAILLLDFKEFLSFKEERFLA